MTGRDRICTVALLGLGFAAAAASSAVSLVQAATMPWGVLAAAAVGGPAHVPRHSRIGCRGGPCSGRTRVGAAKQDRDAPRRPHPRRTRRCHRRGGPGTDSRAISTARLPGERRRRVVASALTGQPLLITRSGRIRRMTRSVLISLGYSPSTYRRASVSMCSRAPSVVSSSTSPVTERYR